MSEGPDAAAERVRYVLNLFDNYNPVFAQTYVPLEVSALDERAVEPQ